MTELLLVVILAFAIGYAVRDAISRRRRREAKRRYDRGKAADLAARNPRFMLVPESVAWNRSLWPWTLQQKNVAATRAKRRHRIGDVILLAGC